MAASSSETRVHFRAIRFIHEAALRLHMPCSPVATAAVIYHRFFRDCSIMDYDPYIIASSAIYLAGKIEEEHLKIRDVINVCYRTLHKNKLPLEVDEKYWELKDSVANCELLLLRMLGFKVSFNHPHRYLLHYLKYIQDWFEQHRWEKVPLAKTAWSLLRDSYHGTVCLKYKPQHIAVSIIYLALQCHNIELPFTQFASIPWWKVFAEDISIDTVKDIAKEVLDIYNLEPSI